MAFWTLFEVASMPVLQVLIISLLGAYMATEYCNLLPLRARRYLNKVCCFKFLHDPACFRVISKVFEAWFANADCVCGVHTFPHVCKCCRDCHIWWHHFMVGYTCMKIFPFSWTFRIHGQFGLSFFRWFMIVNVALTFLIGSILGWLVVKILKPKPYQEGLVIASCSSGDSCSKFFPELSHWCNLLMN